MTSPKRETAAPNASRDGGRKTEATKHQRVSGYQSADEGASPLDRALGITIFDDPHALTKTDTTKTLRELARLIPKRTAASKAELRWLKLATFGDIRTTKKSLRHNPNVLAINGVEGDYDGGRMSIGDAAKRLREAGVATLLYTSPSHRPDVPRWRVLCPTSRPLPPAEREQLIARVNGVLGGVLAGESFILSQSYYYGQAEIAEDKKTGERWPGYPVETRLVEGLASDLADGLDAGALDKDGKPWGLPDEPDSDDDEMPTEPDVERITRSLAVIPASAMEGYHDWLKVGLAIHHEFGGSAEGKALWDEASQRCNGYDADELADTWESFGRYSGRPVTIGTIYHLAKQHAPKKARRGGLTFYSPGESAAVPSPEYVWKHMLARGDVACIFGPPGAGKSLIGPHIAYQVALGEEAFGLRTKPGLAFYVAAEDEAGLHERVSGILARQGDTPNFKLVGGVSDLFSDDAPDLNELLDAVEQQRPALIVIDTLAIAFPGLEENEARSMGRVVAVCRQLAQHGAAVILVHHGTKADGSTPRGHSSLNGALEMTLRIERGADGIVRGMPGKNKRGTSAREFAFRIGVEVLGTDEDGEPIEAPIVEEIAGTTARNRVRLTDAEGAALSKLNELEADGRVTEDEWRAACIAERKVSGSEDEDSRKRAMRRVVQGLAKKGVVTINDGFVTASEATSEEE